MKNENRRKLLYELFIVHSAVSLIKLTTINQFRRAQFIDNSELRIQSLQFAAHPVLRFIGTQLVTRVTMYSGFNYTRFMLFIGDSEFGIPSPEFGTQRVLYFIAS